MTSDPRASSHADALRFLALLARPGDVFELRALSKRNGRPTTWAGFFDDMAALAGAAVDRSGRDDGVYVTLNPVHRGLLSRLPKNRVHQVGNGDSASDKDIPFRRHLLVDVDPVRPAGISSTDEEHAAAIALVEDIAGVLWALGWPSPVVADSGNGGHLIYAIDLPRDDGGLVARVLAQLSKLFSTATLKVDEKVFNPARISKIYGTLTRKGESTEERPHRVSRIVRDPGELAVVTREQLEAFAPATAPAQQPSRTISPDRYTPRDGRPRFDLEAWIAEHLPDAQPQPWSGGEHGSRKWLLPTCPFNTAHDRREAYIVEMNSGAVSAGCKHDSCVWGWQELRRLFEPAAYDRAAPRAQNASQAANRPAQPQTSEREEPPEVLYEDADFAARQAAELEEFARRDREGEPPAPGVHADIVRSKQPTKPSRPVWWRAPELTDEILRFANDPWVSLNIGTDELVRVRFGGIATVMGGSGSGKSSLVSGLLVEHARHVGPAIALSIELPADEMAGRIVGMRCDASWEEALRGQVKREFMEQALDLPRLFVIDRRNATLENLEKCIDAARAEYPEQPVLTAIDYAQLLHSAEKETRQKVADAFERIDGTARDKRVVVIAVSQMSRAAARQARDGEKIGADSADGGAESAAIERFSTVTLSIGTKSEPRPDGSAAVELSIGKGRMSGGDRVVPMDYWGRTGRWRVVGEAASAAKVRESRVTERGEKKQKAAELAMLGAASQAKAPMSREQLCDVFPGAAAMRRSAVACLIARGELVEVQRRQPRSRAWLVWTPEHAIAAQIPLVRDMENDQ